MSGPITWQNVNAGNFGDSLGGISRAGDVIANSLLGFQKTFLDEQRGRDAFAAQGRENAALDYKTFLQGFKTPEELAAARNAGVIDQRLQALDPRVRGAVLGADEARNSSLMGQATAGWNFQNAAVDQKDAPFINTARALLAQGKPDEAATVAANVSEKGKAAIFAAVDSTKQTQLQREQAAQDRANLLENRPFANQSIRTKSKLESMALSEAERAAEEAKQGRQIDTELSKLIPAYREKRDADELAMTDVARTMGYQLGPDGRVDRTALNDTTKATFNNILKSRGLPTVDEFSRTDTDVARDFKQYFLDAGISPSVVAQNEGKIAGAFDFTRARQPNGTEALDKAVFAAKTDVAMKDMGKNNWYAPGSENAKGAYSAINNELGKLIDTTTGIDSGEDIKDLRNLLNEVATQGMEVNVQGKKMRIVPSAEDMRLAIQQAEGGWFSDSTRAKNAKAKLQELLDSPFKQDEIIKGATVQQYNNIQNIRNAISGKK
jgi:hypothetical protein